MQLYKGMRPVCHLFQVEWAKWKKNPRCEWTALLIIKTASAFDQSYAVTLIKRIVVQGTKAEGLLLLFLSRCVCLEFQLTFGRNREHSCSSDANRAQVLPPHTQAERQKLPLLLSQNSSTHLSRRPSNLRTWINLQRENFRLGSHSGFK